MAEKKIYYIAKVIGNKNRDIEVSFLRKSGKHFHVPNIPDIATAAWHDIKIILSEALKEPMDCIISILILQR